MAIRIEENGERFYRDACEKVKDSAIRQLLVWNADEEVDHRNYFLSMKKTAMAARPINMQERLEGFFLQDAVADHAFSLEEADFGLMENMEELLQTAIGFERDSIMFYEMVESFVDDPEVIGHVKSIIDEEKKHIALLEERIQGLRNSSCCRG